MKVFGNGIVIINDSNRYDFIEFNEPAEIEFLKEIDWIVDYNEVKDLSEDEIIALGQNIAEEKNTIANQFNAMSSSEKEENMNMVQCCDLLDFKMYSLRDILWFKQGHLKMELPEGIDLLTGFEQEKRKNKEEKGIRKLINTIFNRNNK